MTLVSKQTISVLMGAKNRLSKPEQWIKNTAAVNKHGQQVETNSKEACAWCMIGALHKTSGEYQAAYNLLVKNLPAGFATVSEFNDNPKTTHKDVIKVFNKTIRQAKEIFHKAQNEQ